MKDLEWLREEVQIDVDDLLWRDRIGPKDHKGLSDRLNSLISQVEHPEIPSIPEFVADRINEYKEDGTYSLRTMLNRSDRRIKRIQADNADFWIDNNQEKFAMAYTIGYTVEEKKYYVLDNNRRTVLGRNMSGATIEGDRFGVEELLGSEIREHQFTEQEIKDFDPRYLPFKVPVEEVEE